MGSANNDLVVGVETIPVPGDTVLGSDLRRIPGSKGANQAVAAARLGRRVAMTGRFCRTCRRRAGPVTVSKLSPHQPGPHDDTAASVAAL